MKIKKHDIYTFVVVLTQLTVIVLGLVACKSSEDKAIPSQIRHIESEYQMDNSLLVKWDKDDAANEYLIEWSVYSAEDAENNEINFVHTIETHLQIVFLPGEKVNITVRGIGDEEGPVSEKLTIAFPPSSPENLTVALAIRENQLNWDGVKSATKYLVYATKIDNDNGSKSIIAEVNDTHFNHENVTSGSQWNYSVVAVNEAGESFPSIELYATSKIVIPSQIVNLTTKHQPDKSMLITWDKDAAAKDYLVEWSVYSVEEQGVEINSVNTADTQWQIDFLPGDKVNITVRGIGDEEGPVSDKLTVFFPPSSPVNLMVSLEATKNQLTWDSVKSATRYNVYVSIADQDDGQQLLTEVTDTQYAHEKVLSESELIYTVVAVNEAGESFPSEKFQIKSLYSSFGV